MRRSITHILIYPAIKKLRTVAGDTLVEALAALLIAALGATLLATMVMASVSVSTTSQQALTNLYEEEQSFAPVASTKISLQVRNDDNSIQVDTEIQMYQSPNGNFTRYESLNEGGGTS